MITLRKADDRGHHRDHWLDSRHTFSFHTYQDPRHMGFRDLRVINEDHVQPGHGFDMHPHRDMEIFSLVLSGALEHRDNLGNREVIGPYQLQKITAGSGVLHSERNPSTTQAVHFLQVWILPERTGLEPGYEIRDFAAAADGQLTPILTPDGRQDSAHLHQDVAVYLGRLSSGGQISRPLAAGRHAWVQVLSGSVEINDAHLQAGDGAALSAEPEVRFTAREPAELLLFDLK